MFNHRSDSAEGKINTLIGKGSVVEGTLRVDSSARVDGKVKGKLFVADNLTLGPNGELEAEVEAKKAIIGGKVRGNLKISERVELGSKAVVEGDIVTKSLSIEEGAIFDGQSLMKGGRISLRSKEERIGPGGIAEDKGGRKEGGGGGKGSAG